MKSPQPLMRIADSTWIDPSTISSITIRQIGSGRPPWSAGRVVILTMRSGKPIEIEFNGDEQLEQADTFVDRIVKARDGEEA